MRIIKKYYYIYAASSNVIKKIQLDTHNITLVSFYSIIAECERDILNDLYKFDLLDPLNLKVRDTKKIFYFHIIKKICDFLKKSKECNRLIFYFNIDDMPRTEITEYCNNFRFKSFVHTIAKKLNQLFPVKFYFGVIPFAEFGYIESRNRGEVKDIIMQIREKLKSFKIENYTFSKIKQFTEKYELTYLSKGYFDQLKVKAIMYK